MRILVTGSRDWSDALKIKAELFRAAYGLDPAWRHMTLVSGACPTGADRMAEEFADAWGWAVERHPADWSQGRKAGPERNAHMVSLGADACLAFISDCTSPRCHIEGEHPSHGATGCADLAEKSGIPVRRFGPS